MTTPRDDIAGLVTWLNGLAAKGGKGVVDNIDARSLGRIATQLDSLSAERTYLASFVQKLQCALMYWMPGVTGAVENETNGRCGDDAQLLAGYEGEFPPECWGDKAVARADALQARVKELEEKSSFYERRSHENSVLAFEWMNRHDRINAGKDGGKFPSPVDVPELVARALRAEQELNTELQTLNDNGIGSHTEAVVLVVDLRQQLKLAQQERDEAYERCLREARASIDLSDALQAILRLASGPEKEG